MNKQLLALYGLKWNPFSPELPTEALRLTPAVENFAWRIEHALVREGGFALISGDVVTGKSVALRLIAEPRIAAWRVASENFESIHNHSAYAELFGENA